MQLGKSLTMGRYKTQNGMEQNGAGSNCCTIRTWTLDMLKKSGINMPGLTMYGEMTSRPIPATKTGQAPRRQHRATPSVWNILAIYLESSSGFTDPSLTSNRLVMSLPSLALDSVVGNRVNSLHTTGTFMCPRDAPAQCDGHIYVPSDVVRNICCVVKKLG